VSENTATDLLSDAVPAYDESVRTEKARPGARGLGQIAAAFRVPAFRWWFSSQILSASGGMTQMVAQTWLLLQLTNSGVALGLLGAATMGPVLVLGAWAGALVDRLDRRRVLIATQALFFVLSATLAVLSATGVISAWMLFASALATGSVMAVDGPARQVFVLELVGPERTPSAVGLYEVVINAARVLGPAIGGVLLATVGATACFVFNAVTFLPPLAVLLWVRTQRRPSEAKARRRGAVRAGLRYVRAHPAIRACMLMAVASGMLFNFGIALPLLATRSFHAGGGAYGALMAAFGVGALFGALAAAGASGAPSGRRVRALALATGAVIVLTAMAPSLAPAFVGLTLAGFLSIWFIALANTLVQLRADPDMRGRVMGIWTMALPGMNPVTGLIVGLVAQRVGARQGFALAGVALILTGLAAWRSLADGSVL
jgi:MFS family permease